MSADDFAHISAGMIGKTEYSLCGVTGMTLEGQQKAREDDRWCQECKDLDA